MFPQFSPSSPRRPSPPPPLCQMGFTYLNCLGMWATLETKPPRHFLQAGTLLNTHVSSNWTVDQLCEADLVCPTHPPEKVLEMNFSQQDVSIIDP